MKSKTIVVILIVQIFFCQFVFSQNNNGKGVGNLSISKLPSKEKRFALIIGVDNYQKDITPLYGSVNDAKALYNVLINNAGFPENQVILMTTDSTDSDLIPNRGNTLDQLDRLSSQVPEDGLMLFSFSGHGISIDGDAFLIPSDGRIYQNIELMRERAIDVLRIKKAIKETKAKQVLMFLDACRNQPVRAKGDTANPLTEAYKTGFSFEVANKGIEAFATIYATSLGSRAYEFLDKQTQQYRGYFSKAIEEALSGKAANEKGEITLAGLISYIEKTVPKQVKTEKGQDQIPSTTVSETYKANELILAVARPQNLPPIKPVVNAKSVETAFWQSIENSNEISDFENYLNRCKRGEFTGLYKASAELKVKQLKITNNRSNGVPWSEIPIVKGKIIPESDTVIFGENYSKSIYLPDEKATFRTAKKFKKLIMKVGVQDNPDAKGSKRISISDENRQLFKGEVLVNRRPIVVEIEISNSDVIIFNNNYNNGQPRDFIRYINVTFVPSPSTNSIFEDNVVNTQIGTSWSKMPIVKGKVIPESDTVIFGEKYSKSIFLPDEAVTFRTGKQYKKLIMKVGVQDNPDAKGSKRISISDENRQLFKGEALVNRRPVEVEIDISNSDVIIFSNYYINGQPRDFIRYINVMFVPKEKL